MQAEKIKFQASGKKPWSQFNGLKNYFHCTSKQGNLLLENFNLLGNKKAI